MSADTEFDTEARSNELADEFRTAAYGDTVGTYDDLEPLNQLMIDRIIELEMALAARR